MIKVPFYDLKPIHQQLEKELVDSFKEVLNSGQFILGSQVETFEKEYAHYCDVPHCVTVGNGLDALRIILKAYGVGEGDEVIVPAHTFIATWLAVSDVGARPVPVDCSLETSNLDPHSLQSSITRHTKAIIAVHLYGRPAPVKEIKAIADRHGLILIEDAAQSHGAKYHGKRTGGLGNAAAFSFYPSKNLGALGDGGAILTSDKNLAEMARNLRNYGSDKKYVHDHLGANTRLDEIQASLLRVMLRNLDQWNLMRKQIAEQYLRKLTELEPEIILPSLGEGEDSVWHLFVIRSKHRDSLRDHLTQSGIQTIIHYPTPPHLQAAYSHLGLKTGSFPRAEKIASECLSLPMGPFLTPSMVEEVIDAVRSWAGRNSVG